MHKEYRRQTEVRRVALKNELVCWLHTKKTKGVWQKLYSLQNSISGVTVVEIVVFLTCFEVFYYCFRFLYLFGSYFQPWEMKYMKPVEEHLCLQCSPCGFWYYLLFSWMFPWVVDAGFLYVFDQSCTYVLFLIYAKPFDYYSNIKLIFQVDTDKLSTKCIMYYIM